MKTRFIRSSEKRRIEKDLEKRFGIKKLPYLLLETGKEKIRGFSGSLSKEEIMILSKLANIELLGLYIIKRENDLRLTSDVLHIIKEQVKSNILDLNENQFQLWIRGFDLDIEMQPGTYIIRYRGDFISSGKSNGKKLFNYIPKDRRLKKPI